MGSAGQSSSTAARERPCRPGRSALACSELLQLRRSCRAAPVHKRTEPTCRKKPARPYTRSTCAVLGYQFNRRNVSLTAKHYTRRVDSLETCFGRLIGRQSNALRFCSPARKAGSGWSDVAARSAPEERALALLGASWRAVLHSKAVVPRDQGPQASNYSLLCCRAAPVHKRTELPTYRKKTPRASLLVRRIGLSTQLAHVRLTAKYYTRRVNTLETCIRAFDWAAITLAHSS